MITVVAQSQRCSRWSSAQRGGLLREHRHYADRQDCISGSQIRFNLSVSPARPGRASHGMLACWTLSYASARRRRAEEYLESCAQFIIIIVHQFSLAFATSKTLLGLCWFVLMRSSSWHRWLPGFVFSGHREIDFSCLIWAGCDLESAGRRYLSFDSYVVV